MNDHLDHREFTLEPADGERLANLSGPFDEHLRQVELRLGVEIANRGNIFRVTGADHSVKVAERVLRDLYEATGSETLTGQQINVRLSESGIEALDASAAAAIATARNVLPVPAGPIPNVTVPVRIAST